MAVFRVERNTGYRRILGIRISGIQTHWGNVLQTYNLGRLPLLQTLPGSS